MLEGSHEQLGLAARITWERGVASTLVPERLRTFSVLVQPSLTRRHWKEQFGRVIVEALWCDVPVVGSDSGEIPWLIGVTEGGLVFPEGDRDMLAQRLTELREQPALRRHLAERGRAVVERMFSVPAATDPLEEMLAAAARGQRWAPPSRRS